MRISDWSSDVCSSDLAVAEVGEHPQQLHRGARPAAFTASTTLKPSRCATRRALPKLASSTDSYGRWRLATSHRRPPGLSTSAATAMKSSEEHTSELQSLIRISYAVFCLKKKTTTKITTINTH